MHQCCYFSVVTWIQEGLCNVYGYGVHLVAQYTSFGSVEHLDLSLSQHTIRSHEHWLILHSNDIKLLHALFKLYT